MATIFQILAFAGLFVAVSCDVCYDDLGCFDVSWLWFGCHDRTPNTPDEIGTSFTLYTKENIQSSGDVLNRKSSSSITSSHFSASRDTKLIVHGWTDSMSSANWIDMTDTLLYNEDVNVVMVDWSIGADKGYYQSRANTRVVGREIARLIEALNAATSASYSSMHIIGHSLGAHIGGYAGEALQDFTNGQEIGRVTGLDPAGPDFGGDIENECRLDKTDATFVDVMHTDGEILLGGGLGLMDELGHQDFYPNNGQEMPGCGGLNPVCDHMKAVEYFIESIETTCAFAPTKRGATWDDIKDNQWTSCTSSSCPEMGYKADPSKGEGAFYLETNANSPYCKSSASNAKKSQGTCDRC